MSSKPVERFKQDVQMRQAIEKRTTLRRKVQLQPNRNRLR